MSKTIRKGEYLLAWFVFWISSVVIGFILGAIAGGIVGVVLTIAEVDSSIIPIAGGIAGFIISIPLSYGLFRLIVGTMIVKKAEKQLQNVSSD